MTWHFVVNAASTVASAWTIAGFTLRYFGADKVAGKVKALASGRLTVVPAGAS